MQPRIPEVTLLEEVGRGRGCVVFHALHRGNACTINSRAIARRTPQLRPAASSRRFCSSRVSAVRDCPGFGSSISSEDGPYAIVDQPTGVPFVGAFGQATSDAERVRLALSLALCLQQLHDAGFTHGGLTAERTLVSSDGARVALPDIGIPSPDPFRSTPAPT